MRSSTLLAMLPAVLATDMTPGYDIGSQSIASTVPANETINFGQHYAVLNLDLITGLVSGVADTPEGKAFVKNTAHWIDTVHQQKPPPLSIFTRIYFSNDKKPELNTDTPFAKAGGMLGGPTDPKTFLYPAFHVDYAAGDVVYQKSRYYAGTSNPLEEVLSTQKIDTVILSGIRTSGVIMSTAYRLFDLNYKVYVIANNTIEPAPKGPEVNKAILEGMIPKLPADVITIEQAIEGLKHSGPAVY